METSFDIESRRPEHDALVLVLTGELDLASSPRLDAELANATDAALVIVDLRGVTFLDSTGLGALVTAHQRADGNGQRLAIVRGPQHVQRLFDLTGLGSLLMMIDEPQELLTRPGPR